MTSGDTGRTGMRERLMDGLAIAREEANALRLDLPDETLGYVLWNETGWPCFFIDDKEVELRRQLREALSADREDADGIS